MASEETVESPAGYRATFKAGDDYGAPWLNVWDTNVEDFDAKLEALTEGKTLETIALLGAKLGSLYVEEVKANKPEKPAKPSRRSSRDEDDEEDEEQEEKRPSRGRSSARSSRGGSSRTSSRSSSRRSSKTDEYEQGEEHPDEQECDKCGEVLVYKSGVSGSGNDYALWTCPKQKRKGDGHTAEFIN